MVTRSTDLRISDAYRAPLRWLTTALFAGLSLAGMSSSSRAQTLPTWDIERMPVWMMRVRVETCDVSNAGTADKVGIIINRYIGTHYGDGVYYENALYLRDSKGDFKANETRDFYFFPAFQTVGDLDYISYFKQGWDAICLRTISLYVNDSSTPLLRHDFPNGKWLDGPGDKATWMVTFADRHDSIEGGGACWFDEDGTRHCQTAPVVVNTEYPFPPYSHYGSSHVVPLRDNTAFKSARTAINGGQWAQPAFGMCNIPGTETQHEQTCQQLPGFPIPLCTTRSSWNLTIPRWKIEAVAEAMMGSATATVHGFDFGYRNGTRYTEASSGGVHEIEVDYDMKASKPIIGDVIEVDVDASLKFSCYIPSGSDKWTLRVQPNVDNVSATLYDFINVETFTGALEKRIDIKKLSEPIIRIVRACPNIVSSGGNVTLTMSGEYPARAAIGPLCIKP